MDTSVWLYVIFPPLISNSRERLVAREYGSFIGKCISSRAKLFYSPLSLSEVAGRIERYYLKFDFPNDEFDKKKYRAMPDRREKVVKAVENAWSQVTSVAECVETSLGIDSEKFALATLAKSLLDGYDPFFLYQMRAAQLSTIITHDRDFLTVDNLIVATF